MVEWIPGPIARIIQEPAKHRGGWESFKMKYQIISTDLRTDLAVTSIALGAATVCAVIGFMLNLVIAPF